MRLVHDGQGQIIERLIPAINRVERTDAAADRKEIADHREQRAQQSDARILYRINREQAPHCLRARKGERGGDQRRQCENSSGGGDALMRVR